MTVKIPVPSSRVTTVVMMLCALGGGVLYAVFGGHGLEAAGTPPLSALMYAVGNAIVSYLAASRSDKAAQIASANNDRLDEVHGLVNSNYQAAMEQISELARLQAAKEAGQVLTGSPFVQPSPAPEAAR